MKRRLDVYLVEEGLVSGRDLAKSIIMEGKVFVNNQKADKAGQQIGDKDTVELRGAEQKYVSRGGLKLEKAMKSFPVTLEGKVAMDIGASTGGFTDCMLQNGAAKVYAVDVGYGQLAWKLRQDRRVVNMERTNIRNVTPEDVEPLDFASVDVAFISLELVLPVAKQLLKTGGELVALIKPQFEAGREKVGKKGVVRDPAVHTEVIERVVGLAKDNGFSVLGLDFSPIRGPEGNIEYLMYAVSENSPSEPDFDIAALVERSHAEAR
ncbi:MAG: TlyA family RNA methyltransferase [Oscillospiraceae bacterium]|nr:TlyA family RNA methyltransferase [Oscillospiraceae bacterium]